MPIECATAEAWTNRTRYTPIPGEPRVWSTTYIGSMQPWGDLPGDIQIKNPGIGGAFNAGGVVVNYASVLERIR